MRLMNIFKSITSFLKNHIWCLVVYFSTITLFLWGADGDLANRAAFAASIVSIVLAIVVIVFTIQESNRMQRIIEQFGQKVEKGQEDVISILNSASGAMPPSPIKNQSTNQILGSLDTSPQSAEESPGRQNQADIIPYYTIKDMRFTDISDKTNLALYRLGWMFGFNLFDGAKGFTFYGHFPKLEPKKVVFNINRLLKNFGDIYNRLETLKIDSKAIQEAIDIFDATSIDVLVADNAPIEKMNSIIEKLQPSGHNISVKLLQLSDIKKVLEKEYDSMGEL